MATFNIRGQKVRCTSRRRFVVVAVRPHAVSRTVPRTVETSEVAVYVPFAHIVKRSDNLYTAQAAARRHHPGPGAFAVVVDSVTGQEVA